MCGWMCALCVTNPVTLVFVIHICTYLPCGLVCWRVRSGCDGGGGVGVMEGEGVMEKREVPTFQKKNIFVTPFVSLVTMVWNAAVWCGWCGVLLCDVECCCMVCCCVVWSAGVWCGIVCGVVWSAAVWCGVLLCGVVWSAAV